LKDFTFVCPTEVATFGKLSKEFQDRKARILDWTIDSEFVHSAWRNNHPDLEHLPFHMLRDVKRDLSPRSASSMRRKGCLGARTRSSIRTPASASYT